MSDRPRESPEAESIARQVRALPGATPDPDFRERLRARFVSGEWESEQPLRPVSATVRARWWHWAAPLAAMIAAVAVGFMLNRGPALEILDVAGSGDVLVNGQRIALNDMQTLRFEMRPGAVVEVPAGGRVDLRVPGVALYELMGGTRMTLPDVPGRWFERAVACSLGSGELRLKTGDRFTGSELRVDTPDGLVIVTGTLLSVQCDAQGTCVCVLEGAARVGVDTSDLETVTPGNRKIMLRDGTVEIVPVKPMHRDGVLDFDKRLGDQMDSP